MVAGLRYVVALIIMRRYEDESGITTQLCHTGHNGDDDGCQYITTTIHLAAD